MDTATSLIVNALTQAIVEHRLTPGAKLVEQTLADHFGVSRTLVRQALQHLSQKRLIKLEPGRGAFVATPSPSEAADVFAVRRMLEAEMTRAFVRQLQPAWIEQLEQHLALEKVTLNSTDVGLRTDYLGDFHVEMAKLMGNQVLAQLLSDLISRCALITLIYQSSSAAQHSYAEHVAIVQALAAKDQALAVGLMEQHLRHVEEKMEFDRKLPSNPLTQALSA